jgi:hypothetical protein
MNEKSQEKIRNFGLILAPLEESDYLFGTTKLGLEIRKVDANWTKELPTPEKQKRQDEDKMCCVTASALNTIETEFNYQNDNDLINAEDLVWLKEKGYLDEFGEFDFSDRYIATLSGTTRNGNSPKKVADCIRKFGLIPEKLLPYRTAMSWEEFYSLEDITQPLRDLGLEFAKRFPINYEFVNGGKAEYDNARRFNPLQVFVHAWNGQSNGVYVRTESQINHAVENNKSNQIFDTYDPYLKNLASDFIYMGYGVRFIISFKKKETESDTPSLEEKNMTFYKKGVDIYLQSPVSKQYHRIGDENTFVELFGPFSNNVIEDRDIADSYIGEPLYLGTSLVKLLTSFFLKLKGKK